MFFKSTVKSVLDVRLLEIVDPTPSMHYVITELLPSLFVHVTVKQKFY